MHETIQRPLRIHFHATTQREVIEALIVALIEALIEGQSERTCVLSTRTDSEAHLLYSRLGFEPITQMPFAPKGALFHIMGLRLQPIGG